MLIELAALLRLILLLTISLGAAILLGRHPAISVIWVFAALAVAVLLGSPLLLAVSALVLLAAGCHWFGLLSIRAYDRLLLGLGVGAILYAELSPRGYIAVQKQLKAEFPLQSLSDRLAYESAGRAAPSNVPNLTDVAPAEPSEKVREGLTELENAQWRSSGDLWYAMERSLALQSLHTETAEGFAISQGFGVGRGLRASADVIRLPQATRLRMECVRPDDELPINVTAAKESHLAQLHWDSAGDFLSLARFGYVRDRDHVAGFQSHAFTDIPVFNDCASQPWRVTDLALVSLLRHSRPCVYETEHLPNLQELSGRDVPTRPLDDFEATALSELRLDRDLVIDDQPPLGVIRMLGALRAAQGCLECHAVPEATLLGAFSYRLVAVATE